MSNPERLSDVLKRVFVPYPESWEDVDIVEHEEPQLDLFGNQVATRLSVPHNDNGTGKRGSR